MKIRKEIQNVAQDHSHWGETVRTYVSHGMTKTDDDDDLHFMNQAWSVCMGESWAWLWVQTSLCLVCTHDLGQDPPTQTSRWVNKN